QAELGSIISIGSPDLIFTFTTAITVIFISCLLASFDKGWKKLLPQQLFERDNKNIIETIQCLLSLAERANDTRLYNQTRYLDLLHCVVLYMHYHFKLLEYAYQVADVLDFFQLTYFTLLWMYLKGKRNGKLEE
ncbi:hypothetical protein ACJX0J_041482, partial [Zea mays]